MLDQRAVDNQIFVAMCSPARDMNAGYHAVSNISAELHGSLLNNWSIGVCQWGHSMAVDPM